MKLYLLSLLFLIQSMASIDRPLFDRKARIGAPKSSTPAPAVTRVVKTATSTLHSCGEEKNKSIPPDKLKYLMGYSNGEALAHSDLSYELDGSHITVTMPPMVSFDRCNQMFKLELAQDKRGSKVFYTIEYVLKGTSTFADLENCIEEEVAKLSGDISPVRHSVTISVNESGPLLWKYTGEEVATYQSEEGFAFDAQNCTYYVNILDHKVSLRSKADSSFDQIQKDIVACEEMNDIEGLISLSRQVEESDLASDIKSKLKQDADNRARDLAIQRVKDLRAQLSGDKVNFDKFKPYSQVSAIFETFNRTVIDPLVEKLSALEKLHASPSRSDKAQFLYLVFGDDVPADLNVSNNDLPKILEQYIDQYAAELLKYGSTDFIDESLFKKMLLGKKGAPVANEDWIESVLKVYEAHKKITQYGLYNSKHFEKLEGKSKGRDEQYLASTILASDIAESVAYKRATLESYRQVAQDPNGAYQDVVDNAEEAIADLNERHTTLRNGANEARKDIAYGCQQEQLRNRLFNVRRCTQEAQEQLEIIEEDLSALNDERRDIYESFLSEEETVAEYAHTAGVDLDRDKTSVRRLASSDSDSLLQDNLALQQASYQNMMGVTGAAMMGLPGQSILPGVQQSFFSGLDPQLMMMQSGLQYPMSSAGLYNTGNGLYSRDLLMRSALVPGSYLGAMGGPMASFGNLGYQQMLNGVGTMPNYYGQSFILGQ